MSGGVYARAGQVLRLLAEDDEPTQFAGSEDPLRSVLRTAADACERFEELQRQPSQTLARVTELEGLLRRAAEVLEAEPLPAEGGSWTVATLASEIRAVLSRSEPEYSRNGNTGFLVGEEGS